MGELRDLAAYAKIYCTRTTQFNNLRIAREWMEAGVPAFAAASWARAGYLPAEAGLRIAAGLTPRQASEADDALIAGQGMIAYVAAMLQLAEPRATLAVDPDVETAVNMFEGTSAGEPEPRTGG